MHFKIRSHITITSPVLIVNFYEFFSAFPFQRHKSLNFLRTFHKWSFRIEIGNIPSWNCWRIDFENLTANATSANTIVFMFNYLFNLKLLPNLS